MYNHFILQSLSNQLLAHLVILRDSQHLTTRTVGFIPYDHHTMMPSFVISSRSNKTEFHFMGSRFTDV